MHHLLKKQATSSSRIEMSKNTLYPNNRNRLLLFLLILAGLSLTIFSSALQTLFSAVIHRDGSSHGIFVPFLAGYILWLRLDKIKKLPVQTNWLSGTVFLLLGTLLFVLSTYTKYHLVFAILSLLCIFGGLILSFFGTAVFTKTAFPLFFLVTMIPLPSEIYTPIANGMRLTSTWGEVAVTKVLGVPLYREGFDIYLPETSMVVSYGCSGIRYLLSLFTFSLVYAVLYRQGMWPRLAVILGSIPLAIFGGIARLSTIFLAAYYISPAMAGDPHILLSWGVFAIMFGAVISIDQYLLKRRKSGVSF